MIALLNCPFCGSKLMKPEIDAGSSTLTYRHPERPLTCPMSGRTIVYNDDKPLAPVIYLKTRPSPPTIDKEG